MNATLEITRQLLEAGRITHTGWAPSRDAAEQCGVNVLDYFDASGKFLGADENGLEPTFELATPAREWQGLDLDEIPEIAFQLAQTRKPIEVRLRACADDDWSNEQLVGFRLGEGEYGSVIYFIDANGREWLYCQVYRQPVGAQ